MEDPPALQIKADNKMKLGIEQVGKGGLPPLLPDVGSESASGGKPRFPPCSIERFALNPGYFTDSCVSKKTERKAKEAQRKT